MQTATHTNIASVMRAWEHAHADKDLEGLMELYEEDARFVTTSRKLEGRAAIRESFRRSFDSEVGEIRFQTQDFFEDGSLVVEVGRWVAHDPGKVPDGQGTYVVRYRRRPDGSLGIILDVGIPDSAAAAGWHLLPSAGA